MNGLTTSLLAGIIWDIIKMCGKFSKDILKDKLSAWLINEDTIKEIADSIKEAPDFCLESKENIKSYLELNRAIVENLNRPSRKALYMRQEIHNNSGIAVENAGDNSPIFVNQYTSREPPRLADGKIFSIIEDYIRFRKIQIVKSFSYSRSTPVIEKDPEEGLLVLSHILVPSLQNGFLMTLFSYIPSENWLHFAELGYRLEFSLSASANIHDMQLQIKDSSQKQFVDIPLVLENTQLHFTRSLADLSNISAWKDLGEICFTIFLENNELSGQEVFYKISKFNLIP